MTTDVNPEEIKRQVIEKLTAKNPDADPAEIVTIVDEEFAALADRPVRDYLSVLTERAAKKRIKKNA